MVDETTWKYAKPSILMQEKNNLFLRSSDLGTQKKSLNVNVQMQWIIKRQMAHCPSLNSGKVQVFIPSNSLKSTATGTLANGQVSRSKEKYSCD